MFKAIETDFKYLGPFCRELPKNIKFTENFLPVRKLTTTA
jgi:hypothetical protein